ncbi:MAG: ACT domain-containing protein [Clostridia bacterium]|nr:ACT domain-containing protein [Clostridia bacterium]
MQIKKIDGAFSVMKLENEYVPKEGFYFTAKTDEEFSLVCKTEFAPLNYVERSDGWKAFKVVGTLDFSLVGILSKITAALAEKNIPVFAVSTYNTDYILVKSEFYDSAQNALNSNGYEIL